MAARTYGIKPRLDGETKPVTAEQPGEPAVEQKLAPPVASTAPVNLADECQLCHQHETVTVHTKDDDGNKLKNVRCQRSGCGYIARFKNGKIQ